jgi:hypothetical protein
MCVNNRRARDAVERARTKCRMPRTYATSLRTSPRRSLRFEHPFLGNPIVDSTEHYGRNHLECQQTQLLGEAHYLHNISSRNISEWLNVCGINLYEHGVRWPRDELDELPNLRVQSQQTSSQCIAWQIFKDDSAAHLPSFEELVPRLDIESCRDAWFLEKPIKLKEDRVEDFKEYSLDETVPNIRLLNVPGTKEMVSRRSQSQHSVIVRERVQHSYGVGDGHSIKSTMRPRM